MKMSIITQTSTTHIPTSHSHYFQSPKKTAQTKSVNAKSNYISENRFKVLSVDNDRDIIGDHHEDKSTEPTTP